VIYSEAYWRTKGIRIAIIWFFQHFVCYLEHKANFIYETEDADMDHSSYSLNLQGLSSTDCSSLSVSQSPAPTYIYKTKHNTFGAESFPKHPCCQQFQDIRLYGERPSKPIIGQAMHYEFYIARSTSSLLCLILLLACHRWETATATAVLRGSLIEDWSWTDSGYCLERGRTMIGADRIRAGDRVTWGCLPMLHCAFWRLDYAVV
jgi:hypothetical protein